MSDDSKALDLVEKALNLLSEKLAAKGKSEEARIIREAAFPGIWPGKRERLKDRVRGPINKGKPMQTGKPEILEKDWYKNPDVIQIDPQDEEPLPVKELVDLVRGYKSLGVNQIEAEYRRLDKSQSKKDKRRLNLLKGVIIEDKGDDTYLKNLMHKNKIQKNARDLEIISKKMRDSGYSKIANVVYSLSEKVGSMLEKAGDREESAIGVTSSLYEIAGSTLGNIDQNVILDAVKKYSRMSKSDLKEEIEKLKEITEDSATNKALIAVIETIIENPGFAEDLGHSDSKSLRDAMGTISKKIKALKTAKVLKQAANVAKLIGKEEAAYELRSLIVRTAGTASMDESFKLKSLEDQFESIAVGDPNLVLKKFKGLIEELEGTIGETLKKVKKFDTGTLKRIIDNTIIEYNKDPEGKEGKSEELVKLIVDTIRKMDSAIQEEFNKYNRYSRRIQ